MQYNDYYVSNILLNYTVYQLYTVTQHGLTYTDQLGLYRPTNVFCIGY